MTNKVKRYTPAPQTGLSELEYLRVVRDAALRFVTLTPRDLYLLDENSSADYDATEGADILDAFACRIYCSGEGPRASTEFIQAKLKDLLDILSWTAEPIEPD